MKKLTFSIFLFLFSITTLHAQQVIPAPSAIVKPDPAALKNIKAGKAYLVDVRTAEEFSGGHLQHAVNINYNSPDFKEQIGKLDKNKPVYLYCRSGNRSGKAADTLNALGFRTFYNIGGFEQLKSEGFPADQSSSAVSRK